MPAHNFAIITVRIAICEPRDKNNRDENNVEINGNIYGGNIDAKNKARWPINLPDVSYHRTHRILLCMRASVQNHLSVSPSLSQN